MKNNKNLHRTPDPPPHSIKLLNMEVFERWQLSKWGQGWNFFTTFETYHHYIPVWMLSWPIWKLYVAIVIDAELFQALMRQHVFKNTRLITSSCIIIPVPFLFNVFIFSGIQFKLVLLISRCCKLVFAYLQATQWDIRSMTISMPVEWE